MEKEYIEITKNRLFKSSCDHCKKVISADWKNPPEIISMFFDLKGKRIKLAEVHSISPADFRLKNFCSLVCGEQFYSI